ncbi:WhiB family transcriptional regulator [Streptomyces sp. NPDC002088]|uniref:WhiB family transcriptional regulator n=1 Tax=Streptomyces sp. NPDC002088 TaxID=3154665 RepID=UPI00331A49A0
MSYTGSIPDTTTTPGWHMQALCAQPEYRGQQDELWFAPDRRAEAIEEAKRLCHLCPVRMACLRAEMAAEGNAGRDRRFGVRGGLTGGERHALHKELQRRKRLAEQTQDAA